MRGGLGKINSNLIKKLADFTLSKEVEFKLFLFIFFIFALAPSLTNQIGSLYNRESLVGSPIHYFSLNKPIEPLIFLILILLLTLGYIYELYKKSIMILFYIIITLHLKFDYIYVLYVIFSIYVVILLSYTFKTPITLPKWNFFNLNRIKLIDLCFIFSSGLLFWILAVSYFMNNRIYFFSLHLSEFVLVPYFSDSLFKLSSILSRHGYYDAFIGFVSQLLTNDLISASFISEMFVKIGTPLDFFTMSFLGWMLFGRVGSVLIFFTFPAFFSLLTTNHNLALASLFFIFFNFKNTNFKYILLGLFTGIYTFLRIDFGIICTGALAIALFINRNYLNLFVFILINLISLFLIPIIFGLGSPFVFWIDIFNILIKGNSFVWGTPDINYSSTLGIQVLNSLAVIFIFTVFCIKQWRNFNQTWKSFSALLVTFLFGNLLLATGRADMHVYLNSSISGILPIAMFMNLKQRQQALYAATIFFCCILLYDYFIESTFSKKIYNSLNFNNAIKELLVLPNQLKLPFTQDEEKEMRSLISIYKNKVSFLYLSPFEYAYFNTKPLGKFVDAYHPSPPWLLDQYWSEIKHSEIIIINKANLDGVPDEYRFKVLNMKIDLLFEPYKSIGTYKIFKRKLL